MKVYAFVPAKSSSDRIRNKNLSILDGERLYIKALKTLLKCKEVDRVFLDTDSIEMYSKIDYLPVEFMHRDYSLATNATDGHTLFLNEVESYDDADIYVQLLCTSPFVKPETIDDAIKRIKAKEADSAILMKKEKVYLWNNGKPTYDINHIPNSKDLSDTITESMGLYISTRESALATRRRYGNNPLFIFGDLEELIDVNQPEDLDFARNYALGLKRKENKQLNLLKHLITSPMLADCIDDLEIETGIKHGEVINGWNLNLSKIKVFGRAATLRIRKIMPGESFEGIYEALNSYEEMSENDVIVVENELKNYAYFGDLNARMAIRSGASAAIIDGVTRDLDSTIQLGFPVFARGYNALDVRRRAVLDHINKPIKIDGIVINPGDLIFADECSIVVIYQSTEQRVLDKISLLANNEKEIATDILSNKSTYEILKNRGNF